MLLMEISCLDRLTQFLLRVQQLAFPRRREQKYESRKIGARS